MAQPGDPAPAGAPPPAECGLVFGDLDDGEEDEAFCTPLSAVSRASSATPGDLASPLPAGGSDASPMKGAARALEAVREAGEDAAQAPAAAAAVAAAEAAAEGTAPEEAAPAAASSPRERGAAPPPTSGAEEQAAPLLSAASDEGAAATGLPGPRQAAVACAERAVSGGSGLVALAVPGRRPSEGSASGDGGESDGGDAESGSEASWAPFEQATAEAAAAAAGALGVGLGVHELAGEMEQLRTAVPAQQLEQPWPRRLGSPPRSPQAAAALERSASWQLQHAAAAAAGTAPHPAPPRSDMHLPRPSSCSSPASPRGEDGWAAWQRRRRHLFVLTAAGKPVFSLHGDEQALAGFVAVVQALVSVVADQGDAMTSITVGACQMAFLLRGSLYFVAASSRGEAPAALRRQLELLYQALLMVVTGGVERALARTPGFDVHSLLLGSKGSMVALSRSFGDCLGWMAGSVEPAAAAPADRQAAAAALADAVKAGDALYGLLLLGRRLVAAAVGRGPPPLNAYDVLLLANFTSSNESLRHSETFVPVCLPNFQPNAFLHAYVAHLEPQPSAAAAATAAAAGAARLQQQQQQQQQQRRQQQEEDGMFLLLLSGSADRFHKLSAAKQAFCNELTVAGGEGALGRLLVAASLPGGGRPTVDSLPPPLGGAFGTTPLWHAVVRFPQRRQHITLHYPPEVFPARRQAKQLVRQYCRLYCTAYSQLLDAAAGGGAAPLGPQLGPAPQGAAGGTSGAGGAAAGPGAASGAAAAGGFGSIVGAAGGSVGSSAAAAAAAAAAYVLPAYGGLPRAHKLVWLTTQRWVVGLLVDREVELFVAFDPLTEEEVGLRMAESLRRRFCDKARQAELTAPGL